MDAKDYLARAWLIEEQIQSKMEQIESLKSLACKVTQGFGKEPVAHSPNVTSMQDVIVHILEAEEELNRKIDDLVSMKMEVMQVIDQVQNVTLRLILEKRYLSFFTWERIAVDMGYTVRWALQHHDEALRVVQKILDGP